LDLGGALLNHDCDPNVAIVFNNTQVQVRALRKLKAGEELLHCYRDIAYDFTFRNPRITSRYQFRCHCKSLACRQLALLDTIGPNADKREIGERCRQESDRHCREAKSDGDAIPSILSTQAALFDIIDESKKQAWASPNRFDVDRQMATVNKIVKTGYAGRPWPNDLEPLPTVLKALAALCERQGDLINSVKIRIKALAFTGYRKGLPWSEDLIDLVLCLSTLTMFPNHPGLRGPAQPKHKEFQDVFIGHLHALHGMLVNLYGEEARVTGIIRTFLQSEVSNYNGPRPATRGFRRRFKASQEAVLRWAGVDEKLWTVE
jgi:SET and MYND domain-containing protein